MRNHTLNCRLIQMLGIVALSMLIGACQQDQQDQKDQQYPPDSQACVWDEDCASNQGCNQGVCHATCTDDLDCGPSQYCFAGFCRLSCQVDTDCDQAQFCQEGQCVPKPTHNPDGGQDADGGPNSDDEDDPQRDQDGDGLPDEVEDKNNNGLVDEGETDPLDSDSDQDGLPDGLETEGHTNPLRADSDEDGLLDGIEDKNRNGVTDPGETDPMNADSDNDGLLDGVEDANQNGQAEATETDPLSPDSDEDGLLDGIEDKNRNGVADPGETDPVNADSDQDGLSDGLEDTNHNGRLDYGETDPTQTDTDGDQLSDGIEDSNQNGQVDPLESNPNKPDTDADGIPDGKEDSNQNGRKDPDETDPVRADTDADGLSDGQEDCNDNYQYDPQTETNPLDADTDNDGVLDGDEDHNGDCMLGYCNTPCQSDDACEKNQHCSPELRLCVSTECASGETSPKAGDTDSDGLADAQEGTNLVCSADNLKPIDLHRDDEADFLLAIESFFSIYNQLLQHTTPIGSIFYVPSFQVAAFLISRTPARGATSSTSQEAHDRGQLASLGTLTSPLTRNLTTFDGFDAVLGEYTMELDTPETPTEFAQKLAQTLFGEPLETNMTDQGDNTAQFRIFFETIYRSDQRVITLGAVSAINRLNDAQVIRMSDLTNSTALARSFDRIRTQCDSFSSRGTNPVDFIWIVDNSASMEEEQAAVEAAADAMERQLANTTLDWRIGVSTTDRRLFAIYGDGKLVGRNFTTDINTFKNRVKVGINGAGDEYGLAMGIRAIERTTPCDPNLDNPNDTKIRCGASLVVVVLSDEDDEGIEDDSGGDDYSGPPNANAVQNAIDNYTKRGATLFAIVGGDPQCSQDAQHSRGYNAVAAGLPGSASLSICDADQSANMEQVVRAAHGVASDYRLSQAPISSTLQVALQTAPGQAPQLVPRSRTDGFDYDGTQNSLIFYGGWRPQQAALDITVSYRSFEECVQAPEICDGLDNDCNGKIDEIDQDQDRVGLCHGDCDDQDPTVFPGAEEICNGKDDDCDGFIDEGYDNDNDGWSTCMGDCDDNDPTVHPDADEYCNGIDDDCDTQIDEDFDRDGDGVTSCQGDCNDDDPSTYPGAEEVCDCIDNNCNTIIDEGHDQDGDGYTTCGPTCNQDQDCDDDDNTVYPGAVELCDGKDNDCDSLIDPTWICD